MISNPIKYDVLGYDVNGVLEACLVIGGSPIEGKPRSYLFLSDDPSLYSRRQNWYEVIKARFDLNVVLICFELKDLEKWLLTNREEMIVRLVKTTEGLERLLTKTAIVFTIQEELSCPKCCRKYTIF